MTRTLLFLVSCVFTQNFVFAKLLGSSALFDEDRRVGTAVGLGLVTAVIMTLASAGCWALEKYALVPMKAEYLRVLAYEVFSLIAALLVGLCLKAAFPKLNDALNEAGMMIAVNCAALGVALMNTDAGYGIADAALHGLFGGLGFLVAITLMAGVQERIRYSRIPEPMKGLPITLVSASLMALAFMGFMGIA